MKYLERKKLFFLPSRCQIGKNSVFNILVSFEASKPNSTIMLFYITQKICADISVYNIFGKMMTLEEGVENAELNFQEIVPYMSQIDYQISETRKLYLMNL